ncbi:RNA-binding protein with multiple splicing 2 [Tyrophagus putrescentiae]|nr:RNA-binding protein with multiple splicing 2 [Tyrophagus putrescentiae]
MDAKPRELYLLFRAYKGYEGSLLKVTSKNGKTSSPVGFVTFSTRAGAEAAKQDLQQGIRFDPDLPQTIRLEFAKSNTKVNKPKQPSPTAPTSSHPALAMHPLTGLDLGAALFSGAHDSWAPHPMSFPEMTSALHSHAALVHPALHAQLPPQLAVPHPISHGHHAAALANQAALHGTIPPSHLVAASTAIASPVGSTTSTSNCNTPPCSTLFVANLGQFVSEQELKDLFGRYPDVRLASHAMGTLNGYVLFSSDRGGVRIEYAKNKMGDVNAAAAAAAMSGQHPHHLQHHHHHHPPSSVNSVSPLLQSTCPAISCAALNHSPLSDSTGTQHNYNNNTQSSGRPAWHRAP